ncbi:mRNA (guanine-N7-)-methyltransferase [Nematocida displodere]|uniref:mRNA cap guanine-N(7) methyltransferase n=1 Tax=Nematocida displodere TaxID=1805483 RepID=A0A177EFV6_9MICR|nr:mRNA (guanine-N7-)-methyltransferase [Nematocida displodere]
MGNDDIAKHYNEIAPVTLSERQSSKIISVRELNNFIKAMLIKKYVKKNDAVLDLGCGKGGDLTKLSFQEISRYYGCDIASKSLEEALNRSLYRKFKANFICCNFTTEKIVLEEQVDLVMSQFSFHYAFSTKQSLKNALKNVSTNLKQNGLFLITIPSEDVIVRRSQRGGSSFGNTMYKIETTSPLAKKSFGQSYNFYLNEAINGCEEYLASLEVLIEHGKKYGLVPVMNSGFLSILNQEMNADRESYHRMVKNTPTQEAIEIIELYQVVVFKKI